MAELDFSDIVGKSSTKDSLDFSDITAKATPAAPEKRSISDIMRGKGLKEQDFASGLEAAKAAARGYAKGAIGMPGEAESFVSYTLPEMVGARATPADKRVEVFPRAETVGKMIEQVGGGTTPEKYKNVESMFELIGGLKGPAKATEKAVSGTIERVGAAISPEATLAGKITKPTSVSEVGKKIIGNVVNRLENLRKTRAPQAEKAFKDFYRDGKPVEEFVRQGYIKDLNDYRMMMRGKLTPEQKNIIDNAIRRVSEDTEGVVPGIESLDKERRFYKDLIDYNAEGASSLEKEAYQKVHDILRDNITKRVASAQKTYDLYANLSKEINEFGTAINKNLTTKAGEYLPDVPAVDPATISQKMFKSEQSVKTLQKLSGDPVFVNNRAREHIANDLAGKELNAKTIRKYIVDNNDWLKELPEIKTDLEQAASILSGGKKIRYGAGATALGGLSYYGLGGLMSKAAKLFGGD